MDVAVPHAGNAGFRRSGPTRPERITDKLDEIVNDQWREPDDYLEPLTGAPHSKLRVGQFRLGADCKMLEETGQGPTTYYPDPAYMRYREVRTLAREHDRDELTDIVATLKRDIEAWRNEFGVEIPDELRASVADEDVSEREIYERQQIAEDWEYTQHRLGLIKDALAQYDRLTARPPATA